MKLDERRYAELLRLAPTLRVVLLYGDDPVLVADRARDLAGRMVGSAGGMFPPTELSGPDHSRALEALNAPMLGEPVGLVRLRDATDVAASTIESVLATPGDALLLVESGPLLARSRLRGAVERSRDGAAMACRGGDAGQCAMEIRRLIEGVGRQIDREAIALIQSRADGTRAALQDAEKLALLVAGGTGTVSAREVDALGQNGSPGEFDDLAHDVGRRAWLEVDPVLEVSLSGQQAGGVLRALLFYFGRLRAVRAAMAAGAGIEAALSSLRPPPYFSRIPALRQALQVWDLQELDAACTLIWKADRSCRETGAPVGAICRRVVFNLCDDRVRRS